ncbi:heavy-metal-associated domain-containing protein [Clostridium sp. MSJ-11]|uniref:Heavy-metal-associated domain-containing protein n=1 Tax=Clostridium mobile TaxID=2841512 RepID=A0ABS6ELZ6_9CLOT|nr:heavy-metal-associated domain-containing protein [Clostridium mobile]MBU5486239.1 heavy-metal-associated domain-containing protein [Clostridium mobile]
MKSIIKICNMKNMNDISRVRKAISNNEGVIACQINPEKGEANIVYDEHFILLDEIIESIEDLGYTIL